MRQLTVQVSNGSVVDASGARTPVYELPVTIWGQLQPLSYDDVRQIEGLNIQGVRKKFYLNGSVSGLVRGRREGGDLITTPDGEVWKVAIVTEAWQDWTGGIVTLQNNS